MVNYNIESLEERFGSFKILLLLQQKGDMFFNEFADIGSMNDHTINKTIMTLIDMKLIERYKNPDQFHRRIYHRLTEKGKEIAQAIDKIEKVLNDL